MRIPNTYQSKYYAYELQRSYANDHIGKLAGLLFDAKVEPKPHQIDAALFALQSTFLRGVILADEVGLGKTIEAGIVISQFWAERKRSILIIAPSSLRQQWKQELSEKFLIPATIFDAKSKDMHSAGGGRSSEVLICSYEFALRQEQSLLKPWNLVVADEAHRLRNFWTGKGKAAAAVAHIVAGAHKTLLLTATPLQNKLEELYGLVSVIDPTYFYSLDAFRERYIKQRESNGDDLRDRVATISKRTLRKSADKYIHFTKRLPLTIEFQPSDEEINLYNLVNNYLQREQLFAFAGSQRHLSALIIRKRLGSSTYAVASTLENIANRLANEVGSGQRRNNRGGLIAADFNGDDLTSDELDESEEIEASAQTLAQQSGPNRGTTSSSQFIEAMKAEVAELREYAALARSIKVNQKAVRLAEAIELGFERLRELGAPEKAIIFTDSTKTQSYISESLREAGRNDGLVLFNGSNDSPGQTAIYQEWLKAHKGGDLITGVPASDRRKALVDYFRDYGKLMVATEAAAEGINLQFCSMVVNYDLPWNPQRVEQRIGRVHRFGQKHNVIVMNFSNKGNLAEQRILELLTNKFLLFESVFGASDLVLGAIEDGLDFERTISNILTRCRTSEELDAAFKKLGEQYATEISTEMASAKAKVFDNLDPHVQDRLKAYDSQTGEVLNRFEHLLLAITRRELSDYATFQGDGRTFVLQDSPVQGAPTGQYCFKSQAQENAHQFRYASPLAQHVLNTAKGHDTPARELTFSLSQSERVSTALKALEGVSGELTVDLVTYSMRDRDEDVSESYILTGAITDAGDWLDDEYVAEILELSCVAVGDCQVEIVESRFDPHLDARRSELEKEVRGRNSRFYDQQEELIYHNQQDRKAEHEGAIRGYRAKEKEARKAARQSDDPMEQLRLKKEARKWEQRAEEADEAFREIRKKLRAEADQRLDLIEESLKGTQTIEHLFKIRWRIDP